MAETTENPVTVTANDIETAENYKNEANEFFKSKF